MAKNKKDNTPSIRVPLAQRVRFEVFKRDKFTCQYCGATAPDVLLAIDHIEPVSKGGDNSLLNLVTSCVSCNAGKSNIRLNDDAVVMKARSQMEVLEERRQQLEMMLAWRKSLADFNQQEVDVAVAHWNTYLKPLKCSLNDAGRHFITKWLKTFSLQEILSGMDESYLGYAGPKLTVEAITFAFDKIPAVCRCRRMDLEQPELKELYYARGILRKRLEYFDNSRALEDLKLLYEAGYTIQAIKDLCRSVSSWTKFQRKVSEYLSEDNSDE